MVPTWNYQVVHVHGRIRFTEDPKFLRAAVALLTNIHEIRVKEGEGKPWKMRDADDGFINERLTAIVGLEIDIAKIVGKSKLGQNREPRDKAGAIEALRRRGETEIANAMEKAR